MKTFVALAAAASLLAGAGAALAGGLLGPPEPEARGDFLALSAGYESNATKWKAGDAGFADISATRSQPYVQLLDTGISFSARGAAFLRAGAADFDDGAAFQDDYRPFVAVGIKDLWYGERGSRLKVGTVFLASYYPGYEAEKTLTTGSIVKAKIKNAWDVGLGIAAQAPLGETFTVYGGPLFVYGRAEVTREQGLARDETTYEEKNPAGVFGGITVRLSRNLVVFAEAQYRSDVTAGASIAWSFE